MGRVAELFNMSPFEPLLEHLAKVRECVDVVRPMIDAVRNKNYAELEALTELVFKIEHQADLIKDEIRQEVPRNFFLPVYRGDLLGYLKLQDDIADSVENLAYLLTLKRLSMPPALSAELDRFVAKVLETCLKSYEMNACIRDLVKRGFHAVQTDHVFTMIRAVERAEWEADKAQYQTSKLLYSLEDDMKPSDLIIWSRVLMELGEIANHAEKTADRLRRMLSH